MLGAKAVARAKINLFLQVGEAREDGYHDINSVMQSLELYDELYFRRTSGEFGRINIRCNDADVPVTEDNLVSRAIDAFDTHAGVIGSGGIDVLINKRIPIGAGLGGGSADAAATLLAMNHMYELEMPVETMMEIGGRIGSDIPFCLKGGTALATGRGEKIRALDPLPPFQVVLAAVTQQTSTREVYERFDRLVADRKTSSDGELETALEAMLAGIQKHEFEGIYPNMRNSLEPATVALERVKEFKETAMRSGAVAAMMSGSGSTVFALVAGMEQAAEVAWELGKAAPITIITNFAARGAEITG
ncbi:MAG: 4-(cytidine 5'-diphospho)-2-C-methyl-D-erythritol kinase [Candidatus Geothermincolia bacterium]